jgi:hypothetical protein
VLGAVRVQYFSFVSWVVTTWLIDNIFQSNQASTLDQTIHYMKSLQHQVQAMSSAGLLAPAAAAYPAVVQPRCVPLGTTPPVPSVPFQAAAPTTTVLGGYHPPSSPAATMVPFGTTAVLQLSHYPGAAAAVMVPVAPLYPAAGPTISTAAAPGDAMSGNHIHGSGSTSSSKGKGSSSLCVRVI